MPHNLDKHPKQPGCYIAYDAQGFAFRIKRNGAGGWWATPSHAGAAYDLRGFTCRTLRDAAAKVGASSRVELSADETGLRNFTPALDNAVKAASLLSRSALVEAARNTDEMNAS